MSPHPQPNAAKDGHKNPRCLRSRIRHSLVMLLSLGGFWQARVPYALANSPTLPVLTTCRAAHHLTVAEANRHYPVHLRAVVTYYEVAKDQPQPLLFVFDKSGSVYVSLAVVPSIPLVPGEFVDVTGVSSGGGYAPIVARGKVHVLGQSSLPAVAPRVGIEDILSGAKDGQWVEIEAVVHSAHTDGASVDLKLSMRGGMILARGALEPDADYGSLIDARILLRGNAAPLFNHRQQITGGLINFPSLESLRVVQPARPDPFALPLDHVGSLLRYTPDPGIQHRVHIRGWATLFWPGRLLCVQDDGDGLCAQVVQTAALQSGEMVDVIGFPTAGAFSPTLVDATYRTTLGSQAIAPSNIDTQQALGGQYDGKLVSMEGQVISEDAAASDTTFILSAGQNVFSIVLAKDPAAKLDRLEFGSRVRVTGICSAQSDSTADPSRAGFPIAKSFRVLLRSPTDLVILQKPSWWNAVHTLRVLAFAFVLALLALGRVALLSRRVNRQTVVIRAQLLETAALKDAAESASIAAEYHAAHDELTGTLNRRTIFAALRREFDAAVVSGNSIGVIMLDLDHFKRVNDTYGHLVGDDILKETVRRISIAVRSSDLVGRYGGEEFIVVLPQCGKVQLQACAERIRLAISYEPMAAGETQIAMTASVGTTVIMSPSHAMLDALAAADSALYQAKHGGRNRVVLKDLASGSFEESLSTAL